MKVDEWGRGRAGAFYPSLATGGREGVERQTGVRDRHPGVRVGCQGKLDALQKLCLNRRGLANPKPNWA